MTEKIARRGIKTPHTYFTHELATEEQEKEQRVISLKRRSLKLLLRSQKEVVDNFRLIFRR